MGYKSDQTQNIKLLDGLLKDVEDWLAAAGTVQQLTAVGYQPQDLQQQLAEVTVPLDDLISGLQAADVGSEDFNPLGSVSGAELAVLSDIRQKLQAAGKVLACFAIPHACNNPGCRNVSGPSEAQLVGGRSCICAGCRTARYCGRACQRAAWRQHKPLCKAMAAAAAATTHAETV
jgi:hypothetical protein